MWDYSYKHASGQLKLVLRPARTRLSAKNGLVNKVEFLGPWTYPPSGTNEIVRLVILTQHFPYNSKKFLSLLKYPYIF